MEKTLSTIQLIAKIGKILSKIAFVCSIVMGCACLVALIAVIAIPGGAFRIGDLNFTAFIIKETGMTTGAMITEVAIGVVQSVVFIFLAMFANRYFTNEMEAGTPFTLEGAKEMKQLGIYWIVFPLAASIVAGIVRGVLSTINSGVSKIQFSADGEIIVGVMFLVMSLVFQYGAELEEKRTAGSAVSPDGDDLAVSSGGEEKERPNEQE